MNPVKEKTMAEMDYKQLAEDLVKRCRKKGVPLLSLMNRTASEVYFCVNRV